jgi:hypothetical protein
MNDWKEHDPIRDAEKPEEPSRPSNGGEFEGLQWNRGDPQTKASDTSGLAPIAVPLNRDSETHNTESKDSAKADELFARLNPEIQDFLIHVKSSWAAIDLTAFPPVESDRMKGYLTMKYGEVPSAVGRTLLELESPGKITAGQANGDDASAFVITGDSVHLLSSTGEPDGEVSKENLRNTCKISIAVSYVSQFRVPFVGPDCIW